ncbi:MAG: hypothetical protein ACYC26_11200 [Phycisphaerales bacterium]
MLFTRLCLAAGLSLAVANLALAQDAPFEPQYAVSGAVSRSTRIVVPAQLHPQVAVSRELAAQPVHPFMVKVILGDIRQDTGGAVMHTWIDPLNRLDGPDGMDSGHSLVRAQRLYLSLSGATTEEINEIRYQSWKQQQQLAGQSRARIFVAPRSIRIVNNDDTPRPLMVIPTPAKDSQREIPTVPQNQQPAPSGGRLMAAND